MPARRTHRRSKRSNSESKTSVWRGSHLSQATRRRLRNATLGVVVVISTLVCLAGLSLWQALHFPLANAESLSKAPFDLSRRTNIILLLLDDSQKETPQIKSLNL